MNCLQFREKATDALAAGKVEISGETARHAKTCGECRRFYEAEANFFAALEKGISDMVNLPLPKSLLPKVREHLQREVPKRRWVWALVPAAVALIFAVAIGQGGFVRRIGTRESKVAVLHPELIEQAAQRAPHTDSRGVEALALNPGRSAKSVDRNSPATRWGSQLRQSIRPEVLVGQDEQRGLVQLATAVSLHPAVGKALLSPARVFLGADKANALRDLPVLEVVNLKIETLAEEVR